MITAFVAGSAFAQTFATKAMSKYANRIRNHRYKSRQGLLQQDLPIASFRAQNNALLHRLAAKVFTGLGVATKAVSLTLESFALLSSRGRFSLAIFVFALMVPTVWAVAHFLKTAPPRHIVLASGLEDGLLHQYARRYIEILARSGVTVEERITNGPGDNLRLLQDPDSGVDIGFTQGGIAKFPEANNVRMIASLYYVPMWIFYRSSVTLNHVNELRNHPVAIGVSGSGARSLGEHVFALNGLTSENMTMLPLSNDAALRALQSGEVDAAIFVDGAENHAVRTALHDPTLKLLSYSKVDAYHRRLSFVTKLTLPPGVIDLAKNIPEEEVALIGTKEMLVIRDSLHPAPSTCWWMPHARNSRQTGSLRGSWRVPRNDPGRSPRFDRCRSAQTFRAELSLSLLTLLGRDTGRTGHHHIASVGCSSVAALPLPSAVAPLARPFTGLSMVRRVGSARARCCRAHGRIAHGEVAG